MLAGGPACWALALCRGVCPAREQAGCPGFLPSRPTVPLSCFPVLRGAWPCLSTLLGICGGPGLVNRPLNWVRLPQSERMPGPAAIGADLSAVVCIGGRWDSASLVPLAEAAVPRIGPG